MAQRDLLEPQPPWRAVGNLAEVIVSLKTTPVSPRGGVYVIEFDSGVSKIGCSSNPASRIASIARSVEIYGGWKAARVAVSAGCTNFYQVESSLHRRFADSWTEGELFRVSIEEVADALRSIELLDETAEREARAGGFLNAVKEFIARPHDQPEDLETEEDELVGRMSPIVASSFVHAREIIQDVLDSRKTMGYPANDEEESVIAYRISLAVSDAILAEFGPTAAKVIFEKSDGYRHIDIVIDPNGVSEDDPRGKVLDVVRSLPAA